jgi:hypothetical protein
MILVSFSFLAACSGASEPAPGNDLPPPNPAPREGAQAPAAPPAEEGAAPEKTGGPDAPAPEPAANCAARCQAGFMTKCNGDAEWCDDVCEWLGETETACLESAPACDKPQFIACAGNGGGSGGGAK